MGSGEKSILSTYNAKSHLPFVESEATWFLGTGCVVLEVFRAFVEIGGRVATVVLSSASFLCTPMEVAEEALDARR